MQTSTCIAVCALLALAVLAGCDAPEPAGDSGQLAASLDASGSPSATSTQPPLTTQSTQSTQSMTPIPDDPYLWLEAVEGTEALAWAEQQNAVSIPLLQNDSRFANIQSRIADILTSDDRIPASTLINGAVYNFWQDATHVRGILRRTSLASYASAATEWETVLDIDQLASAEDANWVYKGRTCLPTAPTRCLLHLSDGGKDAVVMREFDLEAKNFVDGGFFVSEAKTNIDWVDANTLIVGTDFGAGSLTDSGYARTLRLWQRGTDLATAPQIIEVGETDISVDVTALHSEIHTALNTSSGDQQAVLNLITRRPDFFTEENWLFADGTLAAIPLPDDANTQGVLGENLLVLLRSDWTLEDGTNNEKTYAAGSLVALDLMESIRAQAPVALTTVLDPASDDQLDAIDGIAITPDAVYVSALKDVAGILFKARPAAQGWDITRLALPNNGAIQIMSADDYSDTVLVSYQSFTVPQTLYLIEGDAAPQPIKSLQPRFDASSLVTEQHFATSADGTRIPYFIVRPADLAMDGSTPTEMTAYGGFEISETPAYLSALDQVWVENGGAFVLANIRGGGEYGPMWHQSALLENRQRVFDDFIAVAEDIIASGLTSAPRLGIRGGSNGGLLVTAVMVQRPELFNAIISAVPLIDMLRYHQLLAGASWMAEYGNPDIPEHRAFISQYSPYQLVTPQANYPRVFLWTNPKDDRVHPGHARKMAARMQEQGHDVIYFENSEGGHGGGANLNQLAVTNAMQVVYLLQQLTDG